MHAFSTVSVLLIFKFSIFHVHVQTFIHRKEIYVFAFDVLLLLGTVDIHGVVACQSSHQVITNTSNYHQLIGHGSNYYIASL